MRVTFERKGPDVEALIARVNREMTGASRKTAREISKVGVKAFKSAAGISHFGTNPKTGGTYPLKFKAKKTVATPTRADIHFQASPVGFWVMAESGRRGGYQVKPRSKKIMSWAGKTAASTGHTIGRGTGGRGVYSRGETAAIEAIDKLVEKVYADALEAR